MPSLGQATARRPAGDATRPLAGIKVLDLTRVLAGPVATRFLAGYGAEVLRIDPPDWDEPGVIPDVMLGKMTTRLDLRTADDRSLFLGLLETADILVHGLRPGALEALGLGADRCRSVRPDLVDVALDAYGWTGPWKDRRGFDSLVQMSVGIADAGMNRSGHDKPKPLPVQALDHATGYLMAAAAIRGLTHRFASGHGSASRLSLARTARVLVDCGFQDDGRALRPEAQEDLDGNVRQTGWGPARRLRPPVDVDEAPMHWEREAMPIGTDAPRWR